MKISRGSLLLAAALAWASGRTAAAPGDTNQALLAAASRMLISSNSESTIRLKLKAIAPGGRLPLPAVFPPFSSVHLAVGDQMVPLRWTSAADGSQTVEFPAVAPAGGEANLLAETGRVTAQFAGGRIFFGPGEARLEGAGLRLEPGFDQRLAGWGGAGAAASWEHKPSRWGRYEVELAAGAEAECRVKVECAGESFEIVCPATGPGLRYAVLPVGRFHLAKEAPFTLRVTAAGPGLASFALKGVTLRPAPEGEAAVQAADGAVTLKASQATTHSVTMRYEPAEVKNCLGYWVNPADWADWDFTVNAPGAYDVELTQGCGKGQGGSTVAVEVGGKRFEFVVEETGHFQIFLPRRVGRVYFASAGRQTLAIRPERKQAGAIMDVRQVRLVPVDAAESAPSGAAGQSVQPLLHAKKVLVLGDSITYGGEWVEFVAAWMQMQYPGARAEFVNLGLPSETVSGLSEPGHAGGAFPRPDLHERLGRALEQVHPEVVLACYGMNDGIYHPFAEDRFQKFQEGVRRLREQAVAAGAQVILLTPPVFDSVPIAANVLPAGLAEYKSPFAGYDEVLARYGQWLVDQRAQGWAVVDVHGPMRRFLDEHRRGDPQFRLAGDGVHPNTQGHWLIAREVLRYLGAPESVAGAESPRGLVESHPRGAEVLSLVQQSQRLLKDAWLGRVGHKRPGMATGKPLADAQKEAGELARRTFEAASLEFQGVRSLWNGFERTDFKVGGKPVLVVAPKTVAPGRPWVWHGEFFGHKPEPDIALLGRGFHVVYMSVPDMFGSPEAVTNWNAFYAELTGKYGLGRKPGLVGLSRGGLYIYNWAEANPDKVSCLYGDAPVCDLKSWPGGKGKGPGGAADWQLALQRYGFKSEAEALAYRGNPVDNLAPLAAAHIPLLHVYGDADEAVPWEENTGLVAERYRQLGGSIQLIAKPGGKHHPHGLDDPTPIVEFLWKHAAGPEAHAWLAARGGGPQGADGRPLIRRLGTIDLDLVETTPIVHQGRLWRFEWVRAGYWNNQRKTNYFRLVDPANGETTPPFADGCEFGSAFVHDGTVYVTGDLGRSRIQMFASRDLKTWDSWTVFEDARYGIFNTSVCAAGDGEFVLMFEIDRPAEEAGTPFTARFLKSRDLRQWSLTPPECNYAKDRYTAPHCLRWLDGWFYDFYLEARDGYEMRVVRSRDLAHWTPSPLNPVLRAASADKVTANPALTDDQRARIAHATNLNNSDIDFTEWHGRLEMNYSWGNQQGVEFLAHAAYEGGLAQFLRGWFPGE